MISLSTRNKSSIINSWNVIFPVLEKILTNSSIFSSILNERAAVGLINLTKLIIEIPALNDQLYLSLDLLRTLPPSILASISDQFFSLIQAIIVVEKDDNKSLTEWQLITSSLYQSTSPINKSKVIELLKYILHTYRSYDATNVVVNILTNLIEQYKDDDYLETLININVSEKYTENDINEVYSRVLIPYCQNLSRLCLTQERKIRQKSLESISINLLSKVPEVNDKTESIKVILFPLLENLLKPNIFTKDPTTSGMITTRSNAITLVCKIWLLQSLKQIPSTELEYLWFELLDFIDRLLSSTNTNTNNNLVSDTVVENLKNVLLIMSSLDLFKNTNDENNDSELFVKTNERIDQFLPSFVNHVFTMDEKQ